MTTMTHSDIPTSGAKTPCDYSQPASRRQKANGFSRMPFLGSGIMKVCLALILSPLILYAAHGAVGKGKGRPAPTPEQHVAEQPHTFQSGKDFSDGVAWVVVTPRGPWSCIDKTGKVLFELGEGESPESDFSKGVALVQRSDRTRTKELIDKTGKVISSPKSGEYDKIENFIPEEGMIVVSKHIESFEVTETRLGIIDNQGKWKNNLRKNDNLWGDYVGGGLLVRREEKNTELFYNIHTGNSFSIYYGDPGDGAPRYTPLRDLENGYGVYISITFNGTYGLPSYMGHLYVINSNGEKKEIKSNIGLDTREWGGHIGIGRYRNGLFLYYHSTYPDGKLVSIMKKMAKT